MQADALQDLNRMPNSPKNMCEEFLRRHISLASDKPRHLLGAGKPSAHVGAVDWGAPRRKWMRWGASPSISAQPAQA